MTTEINNFLTTNFSAWMVLLSFQLTVLLMIIGCWFLYNRLPARQPWRTPPFVSRAIRRCKAVPSFFSYSLFDEIDELKAKCDYLDKDAERYAKLADEDAKDRISWVNVAQGQCKLMLAADKDALALHRALMQAYDAKVFWQKQCYLLAHFSDWERAECQRTTVPLTPMSLIATTMEAHALLLNYKLLDPTNAIHTSHVNPKSTTRLMRGAHPMRLSHLSHVIFVTDILFH